MTQLHETSRGLSVLVIEDNQGDFFLIDDYLHDQFIHIEVIHRSDFASSIKYLESNKDHVSVILLDLNLPDLKGMDLVYSLWECNFRIPIIILTGYSDVSIAKQSLQIGIYDYLIKDEINSVILHKTITYAINRSSFVHQIEYERLNYETLFNFNPQPTWLLDFQTLKIINANIAAQKKYGLSLDDFLSMTFTQLHPSTEVPLIRQRISAKYDETPKNYFTHYLNSGKEIKVDIYFREIDVNSKKALIIQSHDVSDTLNHINTIEIQYSKLREIAWTQSHILRTPISRILGIINLIEDQSDNLDDILFWLKQLRVSTNEMDDIVQKIVKETNHI